jgi:hypothetical protein
MRVAVCGRSVVEQVGSVTRLTYWVGAWFDRLAGKTGI